jgi:8-oxo-dGTP diphosphatase
VAIPTGIFKVRVGVVVVRDDRILLVRQNGRPFWVLPGGTLELDEGLEACAVRELKEETDTDIAIRSLLYLADFLHPERHVVDVFFLADWLSGPEVFQPPHPENIDEIRWVRRDELAALTVQPAIMHQRLLDNFPNGFGGGIRCDARQYLGTYTPETRSPAPNPSVSKQER